VRLLGALRGMSGKNRVSLKLEKPETIKQVIQRIVERFPVEFGRALIDHELDDPRPNALIFLTGREISVLDGLETMVKDGDEIVLIPVSHGG